MVVDKTRKSKSSKIWPYSTYAISVWRTGQILLVFDFLVLSTTTGNIADFWIINYSIALLTNEAIV